MRDREDLINALAELDPSTFEAVINSAYRRRGPIDLEDRPDATAGRDEFAGWLARRHLASDHAIEKVVYLPRGAPKEIRLLEVNRLLKIADDEVVEPLDFSPDWDCPFRVFVADITAGQWDRIQRPRSKLLPTGWSLRDKRIFERA